MDRQTKINMGSNRKMQREREKERESMREVTKGQSSREKEGRLERGREGWRAVIYPGVRCMLYGFLNSNPATINGLNVEMISIFWWWGLKYDNHSPPPPRLPQHAINHNAHYC